ncbi:Transmembrane transporter swnT [Colletotrichum gloeosporioides]|uniref:Transmembrane transporter swnT n=1 Tax=Colletotrichum gloeosporioides TaxID=474922 RepID=A0A8H4FES7_COLGL|nr:Transmembrane transporter swnT [Colletotrichum gloeosporioides]KAF3799727.1 Transmembrane transporter swnT [Colletotrichum gloeosporioides]
MGILLTVGTTIPFGGAPLSFFGFILMALVGLSTATSLALLASAIPHPGGQYVGWPVCLQHGHAGSCRIQQQSQAGLARSAQGHQSV